MTGAIRKSLEMGVVCAAIGAVTATLVVANATGEGYHWLLITAPVAAFASGAGLWWLLLARNGRYRAGLGAVAGALAGIVSHYLCWCLLLIGAAACHAVTGGCTASLGEAPMNPLQALAAAGIYSLFSLAFFGWLTILGGGIVGAILARVQGRPAGTPARHR